MASIWMSLDSVPVDDVVLSVVVPMIQALGAHGIHANLKPIRDQIYQNEGTLSFALFPGGELAFVYTTGPTAGIPSRYMMAEIRGIPNGLELNENDVTGAIQKFQSDLIEDEIYLGRTQVTEGGSFGGSMGRAEITNLIDSGSPTITTTGTDAPESTRTPTIVRTDTPSPRSTRADTDGTATTTATYQTGVPPAGEPTSVSDASSPPSSGAVEIATSDGAGEKSTTRRGCYVATAAYGGYDVPQVRVLRRFRDDRLATTRAGRNAIRLYCKLSPTLTHHLGYQPWFQNLTRPVFDAIVSKLRSNGISDATYSDPEL